jgi:hypothetical protein
MIGYGLMAEVIEHPAFSTNRRPLDLLFGMAGDEEESDARFAGWSDSNTGAGDFEWLGGCSIPRGRRRGCGP